MCLFIFLRYIACFKPREKCAPEKRSKQVGSVILFANPRARFKPNPISLICTLSPSSLLIALRICSNRSGPVWETKHPSLMVTVNGSHQQVLWSLVGKAKTRIEPFILSSSFASVKISPMGKPEEPVA